MAHFAGMAGRHHRTRAGAAASVQHFAGSGIANFQDAVRQHPVAAIGEGGIDACQVKQGGFNGAQRDRGMGGNALADT